ncbi:MAG: hypothetical protein ABI859_02895 [Pseudomonadota bacterium]
MENLQRIGQLKSHSSDAAEIDRLLTAARPETNRPGHHMTLIQSLPLTIGLQAKRVVVLDALRRQRNVADYTGDDIDESMTGHCIAEARRLVDDVLAWRKVHPAIKTQP